MIFPSTEQFMESYEDYKNLKGYIEPLDEGQKIECAFGAGFSLGYQNGCYDTANDVRTAMDAAKKVGFTLG